ncbi:uncharacterized protein LOC110964699 isoform X2 [Acanthochromis polyacanthus]|uniref:uncharacterized protein LOC110964699 isoform X2 n=1 Tax=Acanthochromis polyacanthus TaxID=80966 RepID=UPI002234B45C|nr:uncharacterized protein LOC110964699 isoform X2 [Acanthochromis polyacanthus]
MAGSLILLNCVHVVFIFLLLQGDCLQVEQNLCDSSCAGFLTSDLPYQNGVRYTYRYSTTITTTLHGSSAGRNGLALDCVVDIDVVSNCHLMMQIRNPQIKRLSPQKEHSVQRLKSLREALERTRLKVSLRGGKVTALCFQEGEQVWALNIKRALLSMLQTSTVASKLESEKETDVYGTCTSRYERRGPLMLKTRDLKQCQQSRLANFWPHSVALTEDTSIQLELHCVQRHGSTVMEEVNCTETVSMATGSVTTGLVKTQTVSTLLLLRAQPGNPFRADSIDTGVLTDLQFEDEGPGKSRPSTPQKASQTVRMLCSLTSEPQLVSQEFLQLVFQLKDLSLSQLKTLWQEASFKCRNDWQPLLDALPACGSENCIILLTDLIRNKQLEEEQAHSFLTTIALIPHPSPHIIGSINALLEVPELQSKSMLAGSSLAYQLCQRCSCSELPQVQTFIQTLEKTLKEGCEGEEPSRVTELFYTLKSVGNAGLSASTFIPLLNRCMLDHSTALELRLAAIQAFRRFPCSADRSVLLQLYVSSQEDTEVRIAAYQQLMRCPDQDVFEAVKTTLRNETSSQVGSFVWSHLTNVLRSEDPVKQTLIESLPDDIISRDFEAEFLKYSSYSDYTVASGIGIKNVETTLIFSPKSFVPRSASANLTVYFHGRAHNLLEVDLHVENAEPLFQNLFSQPAESEAAAQNGKHEATRTRRKTHDGHKGEREVCLSSRNYLDQARAMLFGRKKTENEPKCWVGVKVFGNELSVFTCEDLYNQMNHVSLSAAGLAVKLLKGQEVQLNHRAVLMTEELLLPSLSGVPVKLAINMTSLLSLRLKGNVSYRDTSHFSLNGYIKPNAYVGLSARMGVDSALGQAAVEWVAELKSSTSLDGSVQLQEGRDVRVALNTPEDLMDVVSLSSRVFQLSGDHKEEIKGPKSRVQKTSCTPKTWSKMVGWQLCSNGSYPSPTTGLTFPPPGPVHLSLRLLKLDRGLHYYLLEAAYSLHHQRGNWLPREASIHLLLATPQSSIPRDVSLDLAFNPHRFLLRVNHPLKTIHIQGQLEQERNTKSGKLELSIDGVRYYVMGLVDTQTLLSEQRTRYHAEAKMAADAHPMILSANVTRGLGRKTSFSATVKNVFRETASLSVALERRRDSSSRQYSVEAELLLPGVVGSRMLGLMEQRGSLWSSVLRLKYGLGGDARQLRQECYTSQRLRSERDSNHTYIMRADHEFYCSNTAPINHKIHLRHEESSRHIKSALDMSYGKHWDEINNKHTVLLSQSFKNQSTQNHTSYTLEFNLQVPEKYLNYRTQLLHSHLTQFGSESSTHLKINYNNLMPLVAGLHWKSPPKDALQKKWEGSFNMDTPWLHIYTAHKLNQLLRHTLQITSELTASKWLTIRNLVLEGFYRDRGREREVRLELYTPAATYVQVGVWGVVGKRNLKASGSLSSLWTHPLRADVSLEASKLSHTLHMASTYGKHNVSFAAALNIADKSLKKRQVTVKMTLSKPKSPSTDLEFEGAVEELRRDKKMYQKTAMLQLRQPFQSFPQTLLLRETFTVDLLKGLYILESKAGFHGNREVIHTLTLGYQPPSPFVCSSLTHPFSSDTVPSDSEICVTVTSNQTHKDVRGRLRVGSKERLTFFGQVQLNPLHSSHQAIKVKANFLHQLQLQLPSSAIMEGDVCWTPKNNNDFHYQARGKLRVERQECKLSVQLNGTSGRVGLSSSLSHPFKSKLPKTLEVKATADVSTVPGKGSSSVHVKADGKDRMMLNAQTSHFIQGENRAVGLRLNLTQNLLPSATELHVNLAANMSSDSVFLRGSFTQGQEALLAQVKGSLKDLQGLQLAVSGDLRHTMSNLNILPPVLGLDGALGQSDALIEGQLRVRVMETVYSVEMRHHQDPGEVLAGDDFEEGVKGKMSRDWLCVWSGVEHLCVNVSRQLWNQRSGEVYARLSHSFHLLNTTGVPANSSAQVKWSQNGGQLSILAELQAGREHLKAEFHGERTDHLIPQWQYSSRLQHHFKALLERGLPNSFQAKAHYQLKTDKLDTGLTLFMEDARMVDILLNVGSKNKTALLVASLWQQIQLLEGFIPTSLQMNCTGDATADRLSAHCYGNVADRPVETLLPPQTSVNISITRSGCFTNLRTLLQADGEQKGSLNFSLTCHPHLSLRASVRHSIEAIKMLQFPTHGALLLNVSPALVPVNVGLELGRCNFRGNLRKIKASQTEAEESSYSVNVTSYCPSLERTVLPVSLALQGLLSAAPCQLTVSSSVKADSQDLSLELHQRCRTPHLTGTLTHSFSGLSSKGLPQIISIEATTPGDPGQAGALFIKVGTCNIRANRVIEGRGQTQWLWALESTCPMLQAHMNGSVLLDHRGIWTAMLDSDLEGRRGFLKLHASAWPELSVEAELGHDLPALRGLPKTGRLRVSSRSGKLQYDAEAFVQVEECAVGASGAVGSQSGLQGSLLYHNNCTVIQEWGSPEKVQTSGSLVFSTTFIKSQVSMTVDDTELQTLMSVKKTKDKSEASLYLNHSMPLLKKLGFPVKAALAMNSGSHSNGSYFYVFNSSGGSQKFSQEMTVEKTSETVRVKSHLRHSVNYLKKLGVPANNSIQVELGAAEGKTLTLQSQLGGHLAGLRFKMKNFPVVKEVRGTMWHSWSWLHDTGLPLNMEALCSIQGVLSQLQSRVQLTVDGHKLLTSGLNISGADGRLSARLFYSPPAFNQTRIQQNLDTVLTAQFKGPLRSASLDINRQDWRVRVMGDVGGWGSHGGTKEARATLKHTVQGQASPALQVEAWGRLTESQLRCSMAVNPELSSSLALIVQGHHTPHSKDLMVKVVQNIPQMLVYLPSQLNIRSQLNQSQSSVAGLLEVLSGRRRLWTLGELAAIDSGYRQALEVKHSYPQLKPLPRTIALRTVYEARKWSYQVQHAAVWGNQELSLSGLYSAPPAPETGNQTLKVQITCVPRLTSLEVTLECSPHGRLDSVVLGWTRHGQLEQVKALSLWSRSEETNETKLELKQPFSSTLSQLSLHTLTHNSQREQHSSHQTHLSWESAVPVNVSLSLNKQWQTNSSRGQACVLLSAQRMEVSSVKGCVSVGQEGNSYMQNAELRWDHRSVKQAMKYQKGPRGLHSLQVNVGLDRVSPVPCSSHTLLAKVQTNLRDRVEHTVLLGLCPPQPTLSWSGSHRVNSGEEMFYTRSRLSVTGRPNQCSFTFAITNSSTAQRTNMTLFSESRMGNWSVKVGGNALSWPRGSGLQVQATLDHREKIWLNGTVEGQCVQTTAGYVNGPDHREDLTVAACVGSDHTLKLDVQKRDGSSVSEPLASVSLGAENQRLMLRASGCLESLAAAEERVHYLSSRIQKKLLERIKTLQHLLTEFRRQSRDSQLLQELSAVPLHVSQRVEALLMNRNRGLLAVWQSSSLRHVLTDSLPRVLSLLQHASLLGQQELRRPLATLAGVYQDLKGQRLEAMWREAVLSWADGVVELLPVLLENPHLRPLSQAGVTTVSVALDLAGQHTYQWIETRLATALSGVRKRLASVYKFSPGECSAIVSVPMPPLPWSRMAGAGLMEVLLEEWLLKPLLSVASVRPTAELYRLKRKIMDSPFAHQALLVADQFVVTFDGHLFELPGSCPLLLAQDVNAEPSFTLLLSPDPQSFLLVQMNNSTVNIQRNGQVKADCNAAVSHIFHSDDGVDVRRRSNVVQVSNQNGGSLSCDLSLEVCSFTLEGWLHGASTGLFGTNDNDAGNDFPLGDGSQAENLEDFLNSWQMKPPCIKPPAAAEILSKASRSPVSCHSLFSSPDSPLSSCFRVVDPGRFLSVCEFSSHRAPCRLASAFVHLCQQNYIPLELPVQCIKA